MIHIDYQDKRPIYEQVVEKIQTLIVKGVLESGSRLPSVRNLAIELSINPNTIQRAYAELESSGFIYTIKGRGNFVSSRESYMDNERQRILVKVRETLKQAKGVGLEKREIYEVVDNCFEGDVE